MSMSCREQLALLAPPRTPTSLPTAHQPGRRSPQGTAAPPPPPTHASPAVGGAGRRVFEHTRASKQQAQGGRGRGGKRATTAHTRHRAQGGARGQEHAVGRSVGGQRQRDAQAATQRSVLHSERWGGKGRGRKGCIVNRRNCARQAGGHDAGAPPSHAAPPLAAPTRGARWAAGVGSRGRGPPRLCAS